MADTTNNSREKESAFSFPIPILISHVSVSEIEIRAWMQNLRDLIFFKYSH